MHPHYVVNKQDPSSSPPSTHFTSLSPKEEAELSGHITINKKRKLGQGGEFLFAVGQALGWN